MLKRKPGGKLVTLEITFSCHDSHEITIQFPHFQSQGAHKELEAIPFPVQCPVCRWKGSLKWSQNKKVRVID